MRESYKKALEVIKKISSIDGTMNAADLAFNLDIDVRAARNMLARMATLGIIQRVYAGAYRVRPPSIDFDSNKSECKSIDSSTVPIINKIFAGKDEGDNYLRIVWSNYRQHEIMFTPFTDKDTFICKMMEFLNMIENDKNLKIPENLKVENQLK